MCGGRLKVKAGNAASSGDDTAQDHWDAECADCGEEGDLLCCEVCCSYVPAACCKFAKLRCMA